LTVEEPADALGISPTTVKREWAIAKRVALPRAHRMTFDPEIRVRRLRVPASCCLSVPGTLT
jgi:hypothetical protein